MLHVAITILTDEELCISEHKLTGHILNLFVENSIEIYKSRIATSVTHSCLHLAEAVRIQGVHLDEFSTFPFESYLTKIKCLLHSNNNNLQQIHRRLTESFALNVAHEKNDNAVKFIKAIKGINYSINHFFHA